MATEAFKPIDAQRCWVVRFRRGRSDYADAKVVHCSRKEIPGRLEMVDSIRCPSNDGISPNEGSNTIYWQVALSHVDAVDGSAAVSSGKIDVDAVINNDRDSIADGIGHLGHKSETLSG